MKWNHYLFWSSYFEGQNRIFSHSKYMYTFLYNVDNANFMSLETNQQQMGNEAVAGSIFLTSKVCLPLAISSLCKWFYPLSKLFVLPLQMFLIANWVCANVMVVMPYPTMTTIKTILTESRTRLLQFIGQHIEGKKCLYIMQCL